MHCTATSGSIPVYCAVTPSLYLADIWLLVRLQQRCVHWPGKRVAGMAGGQETLVVSVLVAA